MIGLSCDEYPFASTYQGGAGASTMPVPGWEQSVQGGVNSSFYQGNNNQLRPLVNGDIFAVVVVP